MQIQKRLIQRLKIVDVLLIILPMILVVTFVMLNALATAEGVMAEVIMLGSLVISFIFCFIYGFAALVLSLLVRRHATFRLSLGALLAIAALLFIFASLK